MDIAEVLTSQPAPARVESATDVKPETPDTAATSAATSSEIPTEVVDPKPELARDEKGRFQKSEDDGRVAALRAERERRRQAEAELERIRNESKKPPPSVFENEEGAISERVQQQLKPWQERFFKLSIKAAKAGREDYDEVAQAFAEAVESDPRLNDQLRASDDPGEFIYTVGKQIRELADVGGDVTKYREKIESGYTAKLSEMETRLKALEAENAQLKASKDKASRIPQSLNAEPSVATGSSHAGPTPLKALF